MPDMRDMIAQQLMMGGRGQQMSPPMNPAQGFSPGPQGPNPGGTVPWDPSLGQDIFAPDPSVPANLQDYQQLPSGQFLPQGQRMPVQVPPLAPGDMPGPQEPRLPGDMSGPQVPPIDTPMQAPMDPMMRSFRGRY